MALKLSVLFSLALILVGSNAFSVDRNGVGLRTDYGPQIAGAIMGIIGSLGDRLPLPETILPAQIAINLTEVGLNNSLPLQGKLNLRNVTIVGLNSTQVPLAVLNIAGIFNAIPLNLHVTIPNFQIEAEYDVNALLAHIIPVRGEGKATISLNLTVGLDVEIKQKLGVPAVMEMLSFDYILGDLSHLKVHVDGLLGSEELSAEIGKIVDTYVDEYIAPAIAKAADQVHTTIQPIVPIIFNSLKLTFAQFVDLINQIIGAIGS